MRTPATKTNRLVLALLGCLLVSLIVVGSACRKQESSAPEPNGSEPNAAAPSPMATAPGGSGDMTPDESDETAAVTVNGQTITEAQLNQRIDAYIRSSPHMANLPAAFASQIRAQMRTRALDTLISRILLLDEAKAAHIEVTDDEVLAALEQRGASQNPPVTIEQIKQMVESQGASFEEVKNEFKENMMIERFMQEKFADQDQVSDEEAKAFYDEHKAQFEEPEQVQASHILIRFPESADPNADPNEAKVAAKDQAQALLDQIRAGADFATLAQANSMDPGSAPRGGDLGYFSHGDMVPPFEEAAFGQEPNEVSDVVETRFGYHIIKTTGHKDARTVPFEEAKDDIIAQLKKQKQSELIQQYLESLKEKATIVYPPGSMPPAEPAPMGMAPAPAMSDGGMAQPETPAQSVKPADPNMK